MKNSGLFNKSGIYISKLLRELFTNSTTDKEIDVSFVSFSWISAVEMA